MPSDKKRNKQNPSVCFIVPAPLGISPGQRFRFEHYLSYLQKQGIRYRIDNFYSLKAWSLLYTKGNSLKKVFYVLAGLFKRVISVFSAAGYSHVYVYREAAPIGPPFFEWVMAKVFRKKIIYDFDDAIWIPAVSSYNKAVSGLKSFSKVSKICSWSYKVSVGNTFLGDYARKFNQNVVLIPTVVNTTEVHNQLQDQSVVKPSIGWTGTFSTLQYLDIVLPVLKELQEETDFTFYVIADKDPELPLRNYCFIRWSRETEAKDLLQFHIGLMPLHDDEIAKGKCGFKAIQYMSLGIPAVVSPVGVNSIIVDNAVNGFICSTAEEWKNQLRLLLKDTALRAAMGAAAQKKIREQYSVEATKESFIRLFS